ncbi:MAG: DUF6680 family protein [Candidatus Dormibacteria bacterium]
MYTLSILTIIAILLGPVVAIQVDRYLNRQNDHRSRKLHLFRELMATRGTRLLPRHVEALNLIIVEYSKNIPSENTVINAWKNYHAHLNNRVVKLAEEDEATFIGRQSQWNTRQLDLLTELLKEMSKYLGLKYDDVEIREGVYSPQGWANTEGENNRLRQALLNILEGRSSLPVTNQVL